MTRTLTRALALLAVLGLLTGLALADSGLGRHKKLYVVPVPKKVVIDGKLDDWDLSGQIGMYVASETADMMGARCAMMYDAQALYISGVVRDSSPMMNRHDPNVDPEKAWDADVCQLFMSLKPEFPYPLTFSSFDPKTRDVDGACTLMLWHFTDRAEANLSAFRAMGFSKALRPDFNENGVIPHEKFQGKYAKMADGGGYTFEYRIPWATFGVRAVKANEMLAGSICVFWGRADGLKTLGGNAWCYDVMAGPGFVFQSSNVWGKLLFSEKGNLPKALVEEGLAPEKPLPLKFAYELPKDAEITLQFEDEKKNVVRLLVAQGERKAGKNVELWDGLDSLGNPLPAGTYTWRGITHDPLKYKAIFSVHNSGTPPWPTADNKGGWGGDHGVPAAVCTIPGSTDLLLAWNGCEYGWGIIRVDKDGRKLWGSKRVASHLACDGTRIFVASEGGFEGVPGVAILDVKDSRPMPFASKKPSLLPPDGGDEKTNRVTGLAIDKRTAYVAFAARDLIAVYDAEQGTLLKSLTVPAPGSLAVAPDGSLRVVSGGKIFSVDATGQAKEFTANLASPTGIAVAPDGTVYVANGGDRMNVSAFDKDGKLIREIGRRGGRPAKGKYDPTGLYLPANIALDAANRLWVAECADSPKRISVWDAATGTFQKEFFGGSGYFGYGAFNPAKPGEMLAHNVLWTIDWKTLKGTPATTVWRKTAPDMIEAVNPEGYGGNARLMTANDGADYLWGGAHFKSVLSRRAGDLFKPFLATIFIYDSPLYGGQGSPLLDDKKTFPNGNYLWQDVNDDQTVQAEEVALISRGWGRPQIAWLAPDLSLAFADGTLLRPVGTQTNGAPKYDIAKVEKTLFADKLGGYVLADPEGGLYSSYGQKNAGLCRYDKAGQLLWHFPDLVGWHSALSLPLTGPGKLHGMTGMMGIAGDYLATMTYFGVNHLFTRDGIYVGAILKDGRYVTDKPGDDVGQPEGQGGWFGKMRPDPNGPERYFVAHGGQDSRVWEIFGLDTVKPLPGGQLILSPADVALATQKNLEYRNELTKGAPLGFARGRTALDTAASVNKAIDSARRFTARAAYDAKNAYFRFDVVAAESLDNSEPEPKLVFKGGNCLDIQLAADPAANPKRDKPAPGDVRLLVTRKDGKPFAVLYRPKIKEFKGEPTVLRSPTGTESFDAIEIVDSVGLDYRKTADGFTAVVTVPLTLLGWTPLPGKSVRMDVGYIFGNAGGVSATARAYWRNNGFAANVLKDVPNESRLVPSEWGEAVVE
jgi:hypothetical protein